MAGPWPERFVTIDVADGYALPPWANGTQALQYRLGLQTIYGLNTLGDGYVYIGTLSVADWRYNSPTGDYTAVNTQFRDFHTPNTGGQWATRRMGLGDTGNERIFELTRITVTSVGDGSNQAVLYNFY